MSGFYRVEIKLVKRNDVRSNGSVGKNSALKASAYISADVIQNTSIEAAAYISGNELFDTKNEMIADYSNKKGVVYSAVVLPDEAPKRLLDPEVLWNEVEKLEGRRKDSILFREWICCFEKRLTMEQKMMIAKEYAEQLASEGMAIQYAIHLGHDGNDNDHVHYMGTVRGFENGEWKIRRVKTQTFLLDDDGNRIPVIDKTTGEQKKYADGTRAWKKSKVEYEDSFNDMHVGNVERWRKMFADLENRYLPDEFKVSPDSYIKLGIDKLPGQHLGKAAFNVQKKLQEQVDGLTGEVRVEYLQRILEQVQTDYRKAYYENSRAVADERKRLTVQESSEHKALRREFGQLLHKESNYKPQKRYISNILGNGHLQIEYALSELVRYYRNQKENTEDIAYANAEVYMKMTELAIKAEDHLLITFSSGLSKSTEMFIVQNEYEMQKELLKQLGAEIKEIEKDISLLEGMEVKENIVRDIEQKLTDCTEQIREFRDRTVVESANRITESAREIRESEKRLAELRRRTSRSDGQISAIERREITKQIKKITR